MLMSSAALAQTSSVSEIDVQKSALAQQKNDLVELEQGLKSVKKSRDENVKMTVTGAGLALLFTLPGINYVVRGGSNLSQGLPYTAGSVGEGPVVTVSALAGAYFGLKAASNGYMVFLRSQDINAILLRIQAKKAEIQAGEKLLELAK